MTLVDSVNFNPESAAPNWVLGLGNKGVGINALYPKRKEKWGRNPEYGFDKLLFRLCGVKVGRDFSEPPPCPPPTAGG